MYGTGLEYQKAKTAPAFQPVLCRLNPVINFNHAYESGIKSNY
jgi:hypothetical protein